MKKLIIFCLLLFVAGCVSNPAQEVRANRCDLAEAMASHQLSTTDLIRMSREVNRWYTYPDGTRPRQTLIDEDICALVKAGTIKMFDPAKIEKKQPEPRNDILTQPLDDDLLYIGIERFVDDTVPSLKDILKSEEYHSARGVVIDLRGNLGGSLHSVNKAAQLFGRGNALIGETRGAMPDKYYTGTRTASSAQGKPLVVAVDAKTSSGAELFAAFIKNHHLGTVVGQNTAGAGLVRTVARINNDVIMLIPVSYLFDSNGKAIEGNGIEPDITLPRAGCTEHYSHGLCKTVLQKALNPD